VDYFTNVHGWADETVAGVRRRDDLDVLIDLAGYTGGGNRLKILAKRLAPVQAFLFLVTAPPRRSGDGFSLNRSGLPIRRD